MFEDRGNMIFLRKRHL